MHVNKNILSKPEVTRLTFLNGVTPQDLLVLSLVEHTSSLISSSRRCIVLEFSWSSLILPARKLLFLYKQEYVDLSLICMSDGTPKEI